MLTYLLTTNKPIAEIKTNPKLNTFMNKSVVIFFPEHILIVIIYLDEDDDGEYNYHTQTCGEG